MLLHLTRRAGQSPEKRTVQSTLHISLAILILVVYKFKTKHF